ncbi:MAG: DUF1080 domain-containing protein [Opitutales bacterium]
MKIINLFASFTIWITACAASDEQPIYSDPGEAAAHPHFHVVGEYVGHTADVQQWGLQVNSSHDGLYGMLYQGGLPGAGWDPEAHDPIEVKGAMNDGVAELTSEAAPTLRYHDGMFQMLTASGEVAGQLKRIERTSPTMGLAPPEDALVLFDGTNMDAWAEHFGMTDDGLKIEGGRTAQEFGDMRLHLEFRLPFMPGHKGQRRGNSGVYIMNRYEVQVIDWFARKVAFNGTGAIYRQQAPKLNMCFPPLRWQTYDIDFRAPRFDSDGQKTENARITVHLNGVLIHDDYELESGTGRGGLRPEVEKALLWLQNHTGPVRFRNVWLLEP